MYTEDIKKTIDRFIINHPRYAEDSQLLAHMKLNAVMERRRRLETCVESIRDWCSSAKSEQDRTDMVRFHSQLGEAKATRRHEPQSLSHTRLSYNPSHATIACPTTQVVRRYEGRYDAPDLGRLRRLSCLFVTGLINTTLHTFIQSPT